MLTKRKWFTGSLTDTGDKRLATPMRRIKAVAVAAVLWWGLGPALAQPVATPRPNPIRDAAVNPATIPTLIHRQEAGRTPASAGPVKPVPAGAAMPVVIDARIGLHADRTRFVVELSDPVKFHFFTLSNPDRLVIDMPEVLWRLKGPPVPKGQGAVESYRYGLFRPGTSRFVINLSEPVRMAQPMVLPPEDGYGYRLVLDLFPTTQTAFDKTAGWPADLRAREKAAAEMASQPSQTPAAPAGAPVPKPAPGPEGKVVVIDPGHGGIDSGTIGVTGMEEKNVVLDVGKRLAADLRARGYTVYMTRKTDVFVPLFSRDPFAQRHHADLFVSLHADSNPDRKVHGLSVYTLSEKGSDKEAAALARKENQSDIIAGVDLSGDNSSVASILIDLAQRDTMNRSSRFATRVVHDLAHATDILSPDPHRSANFVVLRSPSIPAVLIELGYLSNRHDCHQMATSAWRSRVARAIAGAVDQQLAPAVATNSARNVE